ncbi:hypothetical protein F5Y16DRAFT_278496 [Xylariaceae sp. FL0255]|nr:hypothetical protein F5Y16DRAFT_278496 [Xylariaceae sp. FL0255]
MAHAHGFVGFAEHENIDVLSILENRQNGCLQCGDAAPDCPASCPTGQSCFQIAQSCHQCAQAVCQDDPAKTPTSSGGSSTSSAGAIAGGVVGGLVLVAILTYFGWKYCIRNKRSTYSQQQWSAKGDEGLDQADNDFASRRSKRESTHTVHSIASTVLTRASNIIQIAYIPGVTNRAAPTSPTLLVPPVPPIPIAHAESANSSPYEDQHFFVPGDLRDSTYSGFSNYTDRTSYARTSYAPRSSVASTIYGKNAVVSPIPAQKGNFLKPSLVSVKSRAGSTNSDGSTPPVPQVDFEKYDKPPPSPTFSIGATFLRNASASTATAVRPQVVRVGSGPKTISLKPALSKSNSTASGTSGTTAVAELESPRTLVELDGTSAGGQPRDSAAVTIIEDGTPVTDQGPFSDPPRRNQSNRDRSLSAVAEEAPRKSQTSLHRQSLAEGRNYSPFGDENVMRE